MSVGSCITNVYGPGHLGDVVKLVPLNWASYGQKGPPRLQGVFRLTIPVLIIVPFHVHIAADRHTQT
jgi:hypothetical protein